MALNHGQRIQGMRGLAAARRAGRIGDESSPIEVPLPFVDSTQSVRITTESIAADLLDQARALLGLTDRQIADRTDLTVDLLAEIDAGRFAVTLEELLVAFARLGLHVELALGAPDSGTAPVPDQPPAVSPASVRLPYRDD